MVWLKDKDCQNSWRKNKLDVAFVGEGKILFSLLGVHLDLCNKIQINLQIYLIQVLCDMGAFIRKWRPQKTVKLEHFYTRFGDKWIVIGKCNSTKEYKLRAAN